MTQISYLFVEDCMTQISYLQVEIISFFHWFLFYFPSVYTLRSGGWRNVNRWGYVYFIQ